MKKKLLSLSFILFYSFNFSQIYQFDTATICANDTIVIGGVTQNSPGIYYDSILCPNTKVLIYNDDFEGVLTWTLNTSTGTNGISANSWYNNDNEGGVVPPNCALNGNGNKTLHVDNSFFPGNGAIYFDFGNAAYETNRAAESPNISTLTFSNLILSFDFISLGDGMNDNASVEFSNNGGISWSSLISSIKSPLCASGNAQWTNITTFLPASTNNISNLKIRFNWSNNFDNVKFNPSIAINDVEIYSDTSSGPFCLIDTIISTFLTVDTPYIIDTTDIVICQGDVYTFLNGDTTSTPGFHSDFLPSTTNGCDTLLYMNLLVATTQDLQVTAHFCAPWNYPLPDGSIVNSTGVYLTTLFSEHGCEFQLTTNLYIYEPAFDTLDEIICANELFIHPTYNLPLNNPAIWAYDTTNVPGTYTDTLFIDRGGFLCDSFHTSILVVNPTYDSLYSAEICDTETFTLIDGTIVSTDQIYTVMFQSVTGCDSSIRVNLTVHPTYDSTFVTSICDNDSLLMPDGTYQDTVGIYTFNDTSAYGCDSIYRVDLSLRPTYNTPISVTICDNDYYLLPLGDTARNIGLYTDTLISALGCDSVISTTLFHNPTYSDTIQDTICDNQTFTLPNNAIVNTAGFYPVMLTTIAGCDSLVTTQLTVNPTFNTIIDTIICQGETYTLPNGFTVFFPGSFPVMLVSKTGCDSLVVTNLSVTPTQFTNLNPSICANENYTLPDGQIVNTAGTYIDTLQTVAVGCDSIITTNLTVHPIFTTNINAEICNNQSYTLPLGLQADTANTYYDTLSSVFGCDSLIITVLSINPTYSDTVISEICDNETYTLPSGIVVDTANTYNDTLNSVSGCDSIITTILTINPTYVTTINNTICDNNFHIRPLGDTVSIAGTYFDTLATVKGCDSLIVTNISVLPSYSNSYIEEICDNQFYVRPLGDTVFMVGTYIDTLTTINGCDSIITIQVIVNPTYNDTIQTGICDDELFVLPDASTTSLAGIYSYSYSSNSTCDSIFTIELIVTQTYSDTINDTICDNEMYTLPLGMNVNLAGTYFDTLQSQLSCDSLITTILVVNPTYSDTVNIAICDNQTYALPDNSVVNTAGTHLVVFSSSLGCDSSIYTNITIYSTYNDTIYPEICDNQTYTLPDATIIDTTGFFTFNYSTVNTCDSIFNVDLSVNPTFKDTVDIAICDNEIHTLPDGVLVNTTGTYSSTLSSQALCDSVVVTNLTVYPTYLDTLYATICDNELFTLPNGFQTNTAGFHSVMLQTIHLCDSLVTTFLTVNPTYNTPIDIDICDNEFYVTPLGDTITTTGVFIDTLTTILACDSFITTTVIVHPTFSIPLTIDICANEWHYLPDGDSTNTSGIFIDTLATVFGCDSVITTNVTVHPTYSDTVTVTICDNETHTLQNGIIVDTANLYTVTLNTNEGCDSVVTTNLIVHPTYSDTLNITICSNQTYTLANGSVISTTGQYSVILQTVNLCDSLVVTNLLVVSTFITPNPIEICDNETYTTVLGNIIDTTGTYTDTLSSVNGCDSVIVTTLIVHPIFNTANPIEICDNEFYIRPLGDTITLAGVYTDTLSSVFACDSVITTTLVVHPTFNTPIFAEICDNEFYTRPLGSLENTTGIYNDTLNSIFGCDSVITTNLTVHPTYNTPIVIEICDNEFYVRPLGDTIIIAGTYTDTLQTIHLCDSVITTTLIVHPTYNDTFSYTICDNEWHYLPDGDSTNATGTTLDTLTTIYGCDSAITTNVTVLPTFAITYNIDICDGETYQLLDGSIVDTTGSYDVILTAGNGCNSTVTTNLTVHPLYNDTIQQIICDNQIFTLANGTQVNTSGFYTVTLFTIMGCDSVVVTDLIVNQTYPDTINDTICDNQTYTLPNGNVVSNAGIYASYFTTALGCDSNIITNLFVNPTYALTIDTFACQGIFILPDGNTTTVSGIFVSNLTTQSGCDSIVTFNLTIPIYPDTVKVYLCDNDSFILPDLTVINTTGLYPQVLTSSTGCDSSQIFDITVYPTYNDTLDVEICDNQTYNLPNGWAVNLTNDYLFSYNTVNGCDSLYTIHLEVNPTFTTNVNDTVCIGSSFTLPDLSFVNTPGIYPVTVNSINGCDSVVITHLYNFADLNDTIYVDLCDNENYTLVNGSLVNTAGIYTVPYTSIHNCDSNIVTYINILPTFASITIDTICDNESYTLPLGNIVNVTGTYLDTLQAINGCDSVVTTNLIVNPTYSDTIEVTICGNQTHTLQNGMIVNLPAFYPVTLQSVNGCDSLVTTNLIVLPIITTVINDTICDNQTFTMPNGAIVNQTGTYLDTIPTISGCDSILRIDLIVHPTFVINLNEEICANDSFTLADGTVVDTTGIYPVMLQTIYGCDSLVNVTLTVHPTYSDTIVIDRCDNQNYVLANGTVVNTTGFYPLTLNSVNGCDSIWAVDLRVHNTFYDTTNIVICADDSITLQDGTIVNTSGNYITSFNTIWGCDSVYYTNLLVNPTYSFSQTASICDNETYTMPDGVIIDTSTIYISTLTTINGCDSSITTSLTVYPTYSDTIVIDRCDNQNYVLANGTVVDTTGFYPLTLNSINGCDSIWAVDLRVHNTFYDTTNIVICADDSITLQDGTVVNTSGNYVTSFNTIWGCDSIYYTNLLVNPTYSFSQTASICDNETYTMPDGVITNTAGVQVSTLTSTNGCDSVITTTLIVYPTYNSLTIPVTICNNEDYQLQDGTIVTATGLYPITLSTKNGCDSIVTTNLTVLPTYFDSVYTEICYDEHYSLPNGWLINVSGIYDVILTAQNGCDSLIRTELLVHNFTNTTNSLEDVEMCLDELEPITVNYNGYDYIWNNGVTGPTIYPTSSDVYIVEFKLNGSGCIARDTIRVIVKDCALTCIVDAPTGFSPNGDGSNDVFSAIHTCDEGFEAFELRIYNRWGNVMYSTNDPKKGWNGRYKGADAPIATYSYTITFKKNGGIEEELVKGTVTLIR